MKSLYVCVVALMVLGLKASEQSLTNFVGFELGASADTIFENDKIVKDGRVRKLEPAEDTIWDGNDGALVVRGLRLKTPFRNFSTVDVYVTPKSKKIFKICLEAGYVVDGLVLAADPSKANSLATAYKEFKSMADGVVPALEKKYNVTPDRSFKEHEISSPFKIGDVIFSHSKAKEKAISFAFKDSQMFFIERQVPLSNLNLNQREPKIGLGYRLYLYDYKLYSLYCNEVRESDKAKEDGDIL